MFNPATEQIMKKRIFYIISFLVIFCIEVLIALYVRDRFIRPYVGDMLVVVLVYSFVRIFLPTGIPRMPFYVFLFANIAATAWTHPKPKRKRNKSSTIYAGRNARIRQ
jgi:hypothetical protein